MSKHSAGPWEIHDGGRFGQYGDFGPTICQPTSETTCQPLFQIIGPADAGVCEANANLVKAAPQMAATGKAFLDCIEGDRHMRAELDTNQVAAFLEFRAALDAAGVEHA